MIDRGRIALDRCTYQQNNNFIAFKKYHLKKAYRLICASVQLLLYHVGHGIVRKERPSW